MIEKLMVFVYHFSFEEVDTTMSVASDKVDEGFDKGLVVWANSQTKGRGRNGKSFLTPPNMGIWCTLGVEVKGEKSPHYYIKAFSVALTVLLKDTFKIETQIKWPNDVYVNHKKLCGLLTELHRNEKTLLLGFGLNLNQTETIFGSELQNIATSLFLETEKFVENKEHLLNEILLAFETALNLSEELLDDNYQKHSMIWGKNSLFNNELTYIVGVATDGALLTGDPKNPDRHFVGDLVPLRD